MKDNRKGVMQGLEFSLRTLQMIKSQLIEGSGKNWEAGFAIGGIIVTLTANLLKFCTDTMTESLKHADSDALSDIKEIQRLFNNFVDMMIAPKD